MKRFNNNRVRHPSTSHRRLAAMMLAILCIGAFTLADYDLSWRTIDNGGGTSTSASYTLSGTIGQHDAGVMTGGDYVLAGGFWAGGTVSEPECPIPADLNCDGVVDGADLLILLSAWGQCADPSDCPADLNNDGDVDGADLLILLSSWG
jgi:hypothetical protein